MRKHLFYALLFGLTAMPLSIVKADTVVDGQSTEGKDFWVTFLKADQDANNDGALQLSISSREACKVTIENPYTNYIEQVNVAANEMKLVTLYKGTVAAAGARSNMTTSGKICYAVNSEQVDTCALHVTANKNISLFATSYKYATFDATNVLPTASLLDEYVVQTYSPSDHSPASVNSPAAGSHFAIVAAEDNVVVDYCPSVATEAINDAKSTYAFSGGEGMTAEEIALAQFQPGDTLHSPILKKGQVWYVWTGNGEGDAADLSGTYVKARDGKKIAVFQGCPHTNIPYKVKQRDHIFSQAMPTQYWGNTFVLTASKNRPSDIIRVLALNDETVVYVNGNPVHTFNFAAEPKHFWEFEIGTKGDYAKNGSCIVTTSCPCAVHLFLTSQTHDGGSGDGDPAMLWVNPIEQQIDQVTFATYQSLGKSLSETSDTRPTRHYVNIVTDKPELMKLDGSSIASDFSLVEGSSKYYYAQKSLGTNATSHTLLSDGSMFIAHVYGFTDNESYGYSAGGATKPLTQYITINGEIFTPESDNTLCGEDTIKYSCHPDYEYTKIFWNFGDGSSKELTKAEADLDSIVPHYYPASGTYHAYVLIYRESSHVCAGQNAVDSIPITVTIGRYHFEITDVDIPCKEEGKDWYGKIFYSDGGSHVNLDGENVSIKFNDAAKAGGFLDSELKVMDGYFQITIHEDQVNSESIYGIDLKIVSSCGGTDTTLNFSMNFDNDVIQQRYQNVLGLDSTMAKYLLSDFQWYRTSDSTAIEGQVSANLNFYDLPEGEFAGDSYYVCFIMNKGTSSEVKKCACAKSFNNEGKMPDFGNDSTLLITATYTITGNNVFVNANWGGKTDIDCYAQWITTSGKVYEGLRFDIPDGGCTIPTPKENGLYLLRVITGKATRSFKFIINH